MAGHVVAPQVMAQRPLRVQLLLELPAEALARAAVGVPVGFADEHLGVDAAAVRRLVERACDREEAVLVEAPVLLVLAVDRECRTGQRPPADRWREQRPLLVGVLDLAAAVLAQCDHAVGEATVLDQRAAQVGRDLLVVVVAELHLHFPLCLGGRPLGHQVHHAARPVLAGHHRGRPAQHLDALEGIGLVAHAAPVAGDGQPQAVEQRRALAAAAHRVVVAAVVEAVHLGAHAGRVAQHLLDRQRVLVPHLFGADHRDRLRHLVERRVGLGRRGAAPGGVARHRAGRLLGLGGGLHFGQRAGGLVGGCGRRRNGGRGLLGEGPRCAGQQGAGKGAHAGSGKHRIVPLVVSNTEPLATGLRWLLGHLRDARSPPAARRRRIFTLRD